MTHRRPGEWRPGEHRWIEHMLERVEDLLKDSSTTELDNLLVGRPRRNYAKRTHEELVDDVNELYDKLVAVVRENGKLRKDLNDANTKLDSLRFVNLQFWISAIVAVAECGVIGFLAKELFARIPH